MTNDESEDNTIYKVVMNHEEQYSIWPADRENALGWRDAGKSGSKAECLAYIHRFESRQARSSRGCHDHVSSQAVVLSNSDTT